MYGYIPDNLVFSKDIDFSSIDYEDKNILLRLSQNGEISFSQGKCYTGGGQGDIEYSLVDVINNMDDDRICNLSGESVRFNEQMKWLSEEINKMKEKKLLIPDFDYNIGFVYTTVGRWQSKIVCTCRNNI